jgi:drug/metabolite transporter (DMT)-like permease
MNSYRLQRLKHVIHRSSSFGIGRLVQCVTPRMRNQLQGFILAFAGMVLQSCNYITAKTALEAFSPVTFCVLWYVVATVYSLILTFAMGQGAGLRVRGKDLGLMVTLGLTLTLSAAFGWAALKLMDPTFSAFLGRLTPMMAILLGTVFLRERLRFLEWVAVTVMVAGGALSTLGGTWRLEWLGIALTLAASFFTAFQLTIAKLGGSNIPPVVMNVYRTGVTGVAFVIWCLVMGGFDITPAGPRHWAGILIGAFLGPCLSITLLYSSYRFWAMTRTAMVLTLQPLAVLPMAYLMFHDIPVGWKLIGGLIIVAGGLWLVALHRPPQEKPPAVDGADLPGLAKVPGLVPVPTRPEKT